jgi:hypothetical protein
LFSPVKGVDLNLRQIPKKAGMRPGLNIKVNKTKMGMWTNFPNIINASGLPELEMKVNKL